MAKTFSADTVAVPDGAGVSPVLISRDLDPTAGGGVAAPLGSLLMRTTAGSVALYQKFAAPNTSWRFAGPQILLTVDYVATGAEGSDFNVPIGATLVNDTYQVFWAPKGVTMIPVVDLPNTLAGDRTTTTFRVITSASLTAGDTLSFLVFER